MTFADHPITVVLAWTSTGACGLGVAVEVMRTFYQINALCSSNCSQCVASIDVTATENFFAGTDIPLQPGSYITAPLHHIITALVLFVLMLSEIPETHIFTEKMGEWCVIFKEDQSPWISGLLEIMIGLGILAIPAALFGNYAEIWLRYITGWVLFGIGVLIFTTGIAKGGTIREWRSQVKKKDPDPDKVGNAKAKWNEFKGQYISVVMPNIAIGAVMKLFNELDEAMGKL